MEQVLIRQVEKHEVEALQDLARKTFFESFSAFNSDADMNRYFDEALSLGKLKAELMNKNSRFYFALAENKIVAYLKVNFSSAQNETHLSNAMEIERIYVLSAYQRLRIGQALLNLALSLAQEEKKDVVWLGVWEKNTKAIAFYRKNGFEEFGEHDFVLGSDIQRDVLMKRLPEVS